MLARHPDSTGLPQGLIEAGADVTVHQITRSPAGRASVADLTAVRRAAASCDWTLVLKGTCFTPAQLAELTSGARCCYVLWDAVTCGPLGGRAHLFGPRAELCERIVVSGSEALAWCRAQLPHRPAVRIIQGYRPERWRPGPAAQRGIDAHVAFTGSVYPDDGGRARKLRELGRRLPVVHFGIGSRRGPVGPRACAELNWRARAVLNLVPGPGTYSNRVVRALASGAVVLSEHSADLAADFGGAVLEWRTVDQAAELARDLVHHRERGRERRELGLAAAARYTWAHQAARYLEFLAGGYG